MSPRLNFAEIFVFSAKQHALYLAGRSGPEDETVRYHLTLEYQAGLGRF
jgi:hypothetical protein